MNKKISKRETDFLEFEQQVFVDSERLLNVFDRHQRRLQHTGQLILLSSPESAITKCCFTSAGCVLVDSDPMSNGLLSHATTIALD